MQTHIIPTHNLYSHHGPRCPVCSGLGHVLRIPHDGEKPTRSTARCVCRGTGVDVDAVQRQHIADFVDRMDRLERKANRQARLIRDLRSELKGYKGLNSRQYWSELIAWATADGTAVADTTTETILFPNVTIPANYMADGRALRVTASGKLSTTGTPTFTWAVRWGGVSGTVIATSEAITMGSGVSNVNWRAVFEIQTRANGASGTLLVIGHLAVHTSSTAVSQNIFGVSGYDAPAATTCDLTADTALSFTGDWSAQSASNTATGMIYHMESLN